MRPENPATSASSWDERVFACVRMVPFGRVITYGAVARALGEPRKAREVGWAMYHCPDDVPAHRVINHLGAISGVPGSDDATLRRLLLESEGVSFDASGRCSLERYGWEPDPALIQRLVPG